MPPSKESLPRWIAPDGSIYLFQKCTNFSFDGRMDSFDVEGVDGKGKSFSHSFAVEDDVSIDDGEDIIKRWKEYLESLVSVEPFPKTEEAKKLGCKCLIDYAHDPHCPVVTRTSQPSASEPETQPPHPKGSLEDILADLVHRMMEQNVSVDSLVKALTPPPQQDPYYVPIPGFKNLADRDPTPIERQCFLGGVLRFAKELKNFNIGGTLAEFFDGLGVPTVKCKGCSHRVPLERTIRTGKGYYGVDCCPTMATNASIGKSDET